MSNDFDKLSHSVDAYMVQLQPNDQISLKRRDDAQIINPPQQKNTMVQKQTRIFSLPQQRLLIVAKGRDSQGVLYWFYRDN